MLALVTIATNFVANIPLFVIKINLHQCQCRY